MPGEFLQGDRLVNQSTMN